MGIRVLPPEPMAPHRSMTTVRMVLLLIIASNLAMIGIRVSLDPEVLGMPGGLQSALQPAGLLTFIAALVTWATAVDGSIARTIVRQGTIVGLASGAIEVAHITLENFGGLSARLESTMTAGFMLGLLLLWGYSGYRVTRITGRLDAGTLSGSWSAPVGHVVGSELRFLGVILGLTAAGAA